MRNWKQALLFYIGVFLAYTALTLVMTWPLIAQMSTHLAGNDVDVWINPWATWWTRKVLGDGLDLFFTDYLFYPQGVSLVFHSFSHVNTVLALMMEPLMGGIAAQNTTTLLAYSLSGFSMFVLVDDLFKNRAAAFVAGVVFAFSPYHIEQALHPVLISVQWIPFFLLFFIRVLDGGSVKDAVAAVVFLVLTVLTSLHLFLFTAILIGICGGGKAVAAWKARRRFFTRALIVFVILASTCIVPLLWPQLREWFWTSSQYGAAPLQEKRSMSLDLSAFIVPTMQNPLWGQLTSTVQLQILAQSRSVFLGFCAIIVAAYGLVRRGRPVMLWAIVTGVFWALSLGPYPRLWGTRLPTLPWGVPLIKLFRVSHRFHIVSTLAFAVLVGWGCKVIWETMSKKWSGAHLLAGTALLSSVILVEYLSVPIPTLPVQISPFVHEMGRDPDDYAVIDLPLGREFSRDYMFQQIYHEKRLSEGVVSRTPPEAYSFINEDLFLARLLENHDIDVTLLDVSRHLAHLSQNNIRYVLVHRKFLSEDQLARWREYLTMDPLYEDALIVVYPTSPTAGRDFVLTSELGAGVGLIRASVAPTEVIQGGGFFVDLRWGSRSSPDRDLDVCLALVNEAGEMLQDTCFDLVPGWPTSEWPAGAIGIGDYKLLVNPNLAGGEYALTARLIEAETGYGVGDAVSLEIVTIEELRLALKHVDSGTFGQDLRLLGYDIVQEAGILNLTLFWRAERRMDVPYKIFVHLKEVGSGSLVAQADVMPRNWMYPTTQWRAGEIVSDKVVLHLDKVSGGRYTVAVGVYHPDTGVRLPLHDVEGGGESSDALILQELTVP